MSVFSPILFRSTDAGAPVLSGTVGALLGVLSSCLICNSLLTAVGGASFVDNTAEARTQGGTGFALFQGPTVDDDEAYIGMTAKFGRAKLVFGTPGVQNAAVTLAWEYWNGSAWAALSSVVDGTSELTADGTVTWTVPGNWATTAVNGVTQFWARVRFTAGSWTTNPLVATLSVTGWSLPFAVVANQAAYQQGGGNQFYLNVNDNGTGSANAARIRGYEAMTALATGTGLFPTAAQFANGLFVAKSDAADASARAWVVLADDRTVYIFAFAAFSRWYAVMIGDVFSAVAGDGFRTMLIAKTTEDPNDDSSEHLGRLAGASLAVTAGHYIARAYTGIGSSTQLGKHGDASKSAASASMLGNMTYPNGPDGGLYLSPLWLTEGGVYVRGRLRGLWHFLHPLAALADGDTFSGAGALSGRAFLFFKPGTPNGLGTFVVETSDTWETN
jgi:hypothetical protein